MKLITGFLFISGSILSCGVNTQKEASKKTALPLVGTWQLISGTTIEKGDTTVVDYTQKLSFIKIINDTHFAFLKHDVNKGKDSATAAFGAGGGHYFLTDSIYSEQLEYCTDREWEGNDFKFIITIMNDTLTQTGIEKVENAGVNRLNIEKYIRLKK